MILNWVRPGVSLQVGLCVQRLFGEGWGGGPKCLETVEIELQKGTRAPIGAQKNKLLLPSMMQQTQVESNSL